MASIRNSIREQIATMILAMTTAGGYNFAWLRVNDPDVTHGGYPACEIRILDEEGLDETNSSSVENYDCQCVVELTYDVGLATETAVPQFAIDPEYDKALDDLKRMFGRNPSLNGISTLPPMYRGDTPEDYATGDYFVTKRGKCLWMIRYFQKRTEPSQPGF